MLSVTYYSNKIGPITITKDGKNVSILTNRLIFRSFNQDNFEDLTKNYISLLSDIENVKLLNDGKPWNEEMVKTFLKRKINSWESGDDFGFFSGYDRETMCFMGSFNIRLAPNDYESVGYGHKNVIEMGGILDKNFWKRGYGSEASIIAKKYSKHCVLQQYNLSENSYPKEIVATVHLENTYSLQILNKSLSNREPEPLVKFGENPRLFFFKPIRLDNIRVTEPTAEPPKMKIN